MSNYERKRRLIVSIIQRNIKKGSFNSTQFKNDVETAVAMKYGHVVKVDLRTLHSVIRKRDIRWPRIQDEVSDELLKYFWVHCGLDPNKRESR